MARPYVPMRLTCKKLRVRPLVSFVVTFTGSSIDQSLISQEFPGYMVELDIKSNTTNSYLQCLSQMNWVSNSMNTVIVNFVLLFPSTTGVYYSDVQYAACSVVFNIPVDAGNLPFPDE